MRLLYYSNKHKRMLQMIKNLLRPSYRLSRMI